jgi:hypothetical protein
MVMIGVVSKSIQTGERERPLISLGYGVGLRDEKAPLAIGRHVAGDLSRSRTALGKNRQHLLGRSRRPVSVELATRCKKHFLSP